MIIRNISVRAFPGIGNLDIDMAVDAGSSNTAIASFEHAGQLVSPAFILTPTQEEKVPINCIFYLVSLMPHVSDGYLKMIFEDALGKPENDLLTTISVEYWKNIDDKFLHKYSCGINQNGFWSQRLIRKKTESIDSVWVEQEESADISTSSILKDIDYPNVIFFDERAMSNADTQTNIFETAAKIEDSMYNLIASELTELLTTARFKDYMLHVARYLGLKDPASNMMISDIDVDIQETGRFIRIYTARNTHGQLVLRYPPEYIKKFLLIGALSLALYNRSSTLFITNLDEMMDVVEMRGLLTTIVDNRTNKYGSQVILTLNEGRKLNEILRTLPSAPKRDRAVLPMHSDE